MTHLWEAHHPYYCNEGNYFANDCGSHYSRWQDFAEAEGDSDLDLNLIFRWDWEAPMDDEREKIVWQGDENYRDCRLLLFYMGQRKGLYRWTTVDVCRADEPAVRKWLKVRFDHILELWEPFASLPVNSSAAEAAAKEANP